MPDFGSILSKSWETAKNFKWLWVYGAILAVGSAGSMQTFSRGTSSDSIRETDIPEEASEVLGYFTNSTIEWFKNVPLSTWLWLALALLVSLGFSMIIKLILTNWAKGALIHGIYKAHLEDGEVNLGNTSPAGINSFKSLIIFSLLMLGVILASLIILPGVWFLVYLLLGGMESMQLLWIILGAIVGFVCLLIGIIVLSLISVFAERIIVIYKETPINAWKRAWKLTRSNITSGTIMGLLTNITESAIGCVGTIITVISLGIPALIIVWPNVQNKTFPGIASLIFLTLLLLIFIFLNLIIRAFITVFNYSNWNQLFYFVIQNEDKNHKKGK